MFVEVKSEFLSVFDVPSQFLFLPLDAFMLFFHCFVSLDYILLFMKQCVLLALEIYFFLF